jgi:hypothetical protein
MIDSQLNLKLCGRDIHRWALFLEEVLGAQIMVRRDDHFSVDLAGLTIELREDSLGRDASVACYRGIEIEFFCADANLHDFHQRLAFLRHRRPDICQLFDLQDGGPLQDYNGILWRPRFLH